MAVIMKRVSTLLLFWSCVVGCSSGSGDVETPPPSPPPTSETAGASNTPAGGTGAQNGTGGGDARPVVRNAMPRAFGASCATGADCDSNVCYAGGHGAFCSLACVVDASCPANATGTPHCNPHGYCQY
jgi:hypothetical protein